MANAVSFKLFFTSLLTKSQLQVNEVLTASQLPSLTLFRKKKQFSIVISMFICS